MTIKSKCLAALEEGGPATTEDLAYEIYGDDSERSMRLIASHLYLLRQDGVGVRSAGFVTSHRTGRRLKLWELCTK